jgi:hypothetical protein
VTTDPVRASPKLRAPLWEDLALSAPLFAVYHVGVAFLPIQNAADAVTQRLTALVDHQPIVYIALTLVLAVGYWFLVARLASGRRVRPSRLLSVAIEAALYALAMHTVVGALVGSFGLVGPTLRAPLAEVRGAFAGLVLSCGAGLYEELAFRVLLFGLGGKVVLRALAPATRVSRWCVHVAWALVTAAVFSGWHHSGLLGEPFSLTAFTFRTLCGLWFCGLFALRGLAVAAWAHALYDVWVLVL